MTLLKVMIFLVSGLWWQQVQASDIYAWLDYLQAQESEEQFLDNSCQDTSPSPCADRQLDPIRLLKTQPQKPILLKESKIKSVIEDELQPALYNAGVTKKKLRYRDCDEQGNPNGLGLWHYQEYEHNLEGDRPALIADSAYDLKDRDRAIAWNNYSNKPNAKFKMIDGVIYKAPFSYDEIIQYHEKIMLLATPQNRLCMRKSRIIKEIAENDEDIIYVESKIVILQEAQKRKLKYQKAMQELGFSDMSFEQKQDRQDGMSLEEYQICLDILYRLSNALQIEKYFLEQDILIENVPMDQVARYEDFQSEPSQPDDWLSNCSIS